MSNNVNQVNFKEEGKVKEINIKEYIDVLKKRIWIIILITLLATAAGVFQKTYFKQPPLYQASTKIILDGDPQSMSTLMVMIKDPLLLDKVQEDLGLTKSSDALARQISAGNIDESQIVRINVIDSNPKMAVDIANTTAQVFKNQIGSVLNIFINVRILSEAQEQEIVTIDQNNNNIVVIAFAAGVVLGIGFVFLLDSLDNTIRSEREIEEYLGVPVLGKIAKMSKKNTTVKRKRFRNIELRGDSFGL